jgi:serine/threonine protein kinase/tetratricopeptide (TPR) repeat protein
VIGKTVAHYRILEKLGEGGMGIVYKAEDTRLKRTVALKFLVPRDGGGETEKRRLVQEAQAAAALDHPNICAVYQIDEVDEQTFVAFAYIQGQGLDERIKAGPLDIDEALTIATQIARGLGEAHGSGIAHRDIKPGNVKITPRGQVKILDFGLARLFAHAETYADDSTSGTPAYMSPEQLRDEGADHRSDIWSLGVVLYEMIAGQRPFRGDYEQAVVYSVLNQAPEPLTDVRTDVPEALERAVSKSLTKDPEGRYQSVESFLADLERIEREPAAEARTRRPVAVISFENLTGEKTYDYLRRAIPNLLITSLEQSQHLQVITWERMNDLLRQMDKEGVEVIDRDLGFELCRLEGIDAIVLGSFVKAGDTFATDAKVLDVKTKTMLKSTSAKGQGVDSILERQIDELSRDIVAGLGVPGDKAETPSLPIAEAATSSMDAYDRFLRGRDAYEKLYNEDARELLEKAVELDPSFAAAHLYLAWTYSRLRENNARDEAFEKAKALSSRASRREQLYIEAAYARSIEADPDKEAARLKQLAQEYPEEKRAHHRLAAHYRGQGHLYKAVEEYNRVLELDADFGWAMNELSYMYMDIEDFETASDYLSRYGRACPRDANPVDSEGELYFRMGRLDEAIAKYREALKLKPDFYYACWEIAYVSALKEDYAEALRWIDVFIDMAPSFGTRAEGLRWKSLYLYWMGAFGQSLAVAEELAELADREKSELWRVETHRLRGWIAYGRGEFTASRRHFERCLKGVAEKPTEFIVTDRSYLPQSSEQVAMMNAAYNFSLGLVSLGEGDTAQARARLDAATEHQPDYARLLEAEILLAEDGIEAAITVCRRARPWTVPYMSDTEGMLAYNLPPLKDVLARAYHRNGQLDDVIAAYERLTTIDPNRRDRRLIHPLCRHRLAALYEETGLVEKAVDQYRLFLSISGIADTAIPEVAAAEARIEELTRGS